MRTCPACSAESPDSSGRFCPDCGVAFTQDIGLEETSVLAPAAESTSMIGAEIGGQFVIESVIGGGSFGTVYLARQRGIDRQVALKIPTAEIAADPVQTQRFAREARAAARITHPGIVAIYAVGELVDGRPYLAMQFVEGRPLTEILAGGPVRATRALGIARQIASALADTHAAGVIHRDLKPSNVMWRRDRFGDDRITIVDFGIAAGKPGTAEATRLTAGGLIGTPHYMSPEQAQGEAVDGRADLYALGCLLFELVTGTTPFDGSGFEVLLAHMGKSAPPPSERAGELKIIVPPAIDKLVVKLLQKRPADRPASADAVVEEIDAALDQIESPSGRSAAQRRAKRPTVRPAVDLDDEPLPSPTRRRWVWPAALGIVAALGAGGYAALRYGTSGGSDDELDGPTRKLIDDEGELTLIAQVPERIVADARTTLHFGIHNKIGNPADSESCAVIITSPDGSAHGYAAKKQPGEPGHYHLRHNFKTPGRYHLQLFTSPPDTRFDLDVDVTR